MDCEQKFKRSPSQQEILPLITKTAQFVKESLEGAEGGHDWHHIERVWKNAMRIAKDEILLCGELNLEVVELSALLHDIADHKFHGGDSTKGPTIAREFLENEGVDSKVLEQVIDIISTMSFSSGQEVKSIEGKIVQDADRLDAIGAIGIARTFCYGGFKNREIYNPNIKPNLNMTKDEYKKSEAPTINHFYEKLLLLKDKMNTEAAKKIAKKRHEYMENFLTQFYKEWDATD
jgi:uncharacterized protein